MGIRKLHDHPSRHGACYSVTGRHPLTKCGLFRSPSGMTVAAGYMAWSGTWYTFDPETGREHGDGISRSTFAEFFEPWRVGTLEPDPECQRLVPTS